MGPSGADPCQSIPTYILPRQSQKKIPRRQIQDLESFGCALTVSNYPPTVEIILWRKNGANDV